MQKLVVLALGLSLTMIFAKVSPAATLLIASNPIPTATGARPSPQPLRGDLTMPAGPGPFPVVILLHGCGGLGRGTQMARWVDRVTAWGYATLVLDSLSPRSIPTVCAPADQPKVTGLDRAGDVLNAALAMRVTPGIDGRRIGVIGFPHGGGTAVTLTRRAFEAFEPALIKAAVNYYGPCNAPQFHGHTPLLSLSGDGDNWGDPATSCQAFNATMRPDQPVAQQIYKDVVHDFDNPVLRVRRVMPGHPLQYDGPAAEDSFARTHAFLDRFVRDLK